MSFHAVSHSTPPSPTPTMSASYPTEVAYDILGWASGEACSESESFALPSLTIEDGGAGPADLYQQAKYKALESMPEADNLMFIRTAVTDDEEKTCVKVTGRGYRVVAMASRPASAADDDGNGEASRLRAPIGAIQHPGAADE